MASVLLSPVGNGQQFFTNNGIPNAGGLIYTYQAGSSTLLTTYTTVNGTIANTNPIVLDAYGRTPSQIWMQTGYSYKFVIQTAAAVTLQTLDNLYPILQTSSATVSPLPTGAILLWSGSIGSIPSGYVLCDGTNATPDLRDRFIIGAGSTYAVGATGGSADAIVVSHTHSITDPGHVHTQGAVRSDNMNVSGGPFDRMSQSSTASAVTGISINTAGVSGTGANIPPYYALAYIMKT